MNGWLDFLGFHWKPLGIGLICLAGGFGILRALSRRFDHAPWQTLLDSWDETTDRVGFTVVQAVAGVILILVGGFCIYAAFGK